MYLASNVFRRLFVRVHRRLGVGCVHVFCYELSTVKDLHVHWFQHLNRCNISSIEPMKCMHLVHRHRHGGARNFFCCSKKSALAQSIMPCASPNLWSHIRVHLPLPFLRQCLPSIFNARRVVHTIPHVFLVRRIYSTSRGSYEFPVISPVVRVVAPRVFEKLERSSLYHGILRTTSMGGFGPSGLWHRKVL